MQQTNLIPVLMWLLITSAPLLLVYLIGLILALARWSSQPRVCLWIALGCGVLLLQHVALGAISGVLPTYLVEIGWSEPEITNTFHALNFVRSVLCASGIGCLLVAAFAHRSIGQVSA